MCTALRHERSDIRAGPASEYARVAAHAGPLTPIAVYAELDAPTAGRGPAVAPTIVASGSDMCTERSRFRTERTGAALLCDSAGSSTRAAPGRTIAGP